MKINELERKKIALFNNFPHKQEIVTSFCEYLKSLPPDKCFRIHPLQLASKLHIETSTMISLLLYAVQHDLLRMEWHLVCEACTGFIHSNDKFSAYGEDEILCPFCNRYVLPNFSENVEVTFSIHPALGVQVPDFCQDKDSYQSYYFSKSYKNGGFDKYFPKNIIPWFHGIPGESSIEIDVDIWEGGFCHLFSLDCQTLYYISGKKQTFENSEESTPQTTFVFLHENNSPTYIELPTGKHTLILSNQRSEKIGVSMLLCVGLEHFQEIHRTFPVTHIAGLSGSQLLNDSRFIDLFGKQEFTDNFFFQMGNLSILFSDLEESTKMYGDLGDLAAYNLVGKHFDLLYDVVNKNNGIVIKTIGDAIMAVFYNKIDAVYAAIEMHETMKTLKNPVTHRPIKLKIGIHHGTVLAINANQSIDYFGQTVNIASRVQSLAYGGEICLSENMLETDIIEILEGKKRKTRRKKTALKGIREKTIVYHYSIG